MNKYLTILFLFICIFCSLFGCIPKKDNPQNTTTKKLEQLNIKSEVANNAIINTDVSEIQLLGWDLESNKGNNQRFSDMQDEVLLIKFKVKNTCVIPLNFFDLFKNEITLDGTKIDSLQTKFYAEDLKERIYSDLVLEKGTEKTVYCCLNCSSDKKHEIDVSVFYPFSSYLKDNKAGDFEINIEAEPNSPNPINVKTAERKTKLLEIKDYTNYKTYFIGSGITCVLDKSSITCEYENYPYYVLSVKSLNLSGYSKENPIVDVRDSQIIYDYKLRKAYLNNEYLDPKEIAPYNIAGFKLAEICFYIKYNKKFYKDAENQIEELKFADDVYNLSPDTTILENKEIFKKSNTDKNKPIVVQNDDEEDKPTVVQNDDEEDKPTVVQNDDEEDKPIVVQNDDEEDKPIVVQNDND